MLFSPPHSKPRSVCAFGSFFMCSRLINHPVKIHIAMSMDNRQEIINVLNMKEHMVFGNRRMPVG